MADLGQERDLTTDWTEITVPLNLVDGTAYIVDVDGGHVGAIGYWAQTDVAGEEPTTQGHPFLLFSRSLGQVTARTLTKRMGVFIWVRVSTGTAKLKVSIV